MLTMPMLFLFLFGIAWGARTCSETFASNPRLCSSEGKVRSATEDCNAECTVNDCCKLPAVCSEAEELFRLKSQCSFLFKGFVPENKCDGIKCNSTELCCASFRTCQEAAKEKCSQENQILDPVLSCSPNGCTKGDCCRDPVCGDWLNWNEANFCEDRGNVDAPLDKNCTGRCDGSQCCVREVPRSCAQTFDANICSRSGLMFDAALEQVNEPCPADGCTAARCCRNISTCEEYARVTKINVCGAASLLASKECSGADCKDPTKCCYTPRTCLDAIKLNPRFCGTGSVGLENSVECPSGVCTKDRCCRPSTTCGEVDQSLDDSQKLGRQCALRQLAFNAATACTFGINCTADVCCRPPALQTCREVLSIDPDLAKKWCGSIGQVFDPTRPCREGRCSALQCCRAPTSCDELQMANSSFCGQGYFKATSEPCAQGQCDGLQCCRIAQTCKEAGVACKEGQALDGPKECFERCVPEVCCKPAQTCREAGLDMRCKALGKVVNYQKICGATGCTIDACCEDTRDCNDFLSAIFFDPKLCPAIGKVAHLPSYQTCDGPCTAERCCSAPTTCADANQLAGGRLCINRGVINPLVLCAGVACTPDKCCQKPQTCADVRLATSVYSTGAVASTQWCSRDQFVDNFDFVICESICTPAECCRKIDNCDEWRKVYETNNPSNGLPPFPPPLCRFGHFVTGPCDGACDEEECCRAPVTCDEAQISCPDGQVLNGEQKCSGISCDTATCCKKPMTCNDVDEFFCFAVGKLNQKSEPPIECADGRCTTAQCCRDPRGCDEAYLRLYTCPASSFLDQNKLCSGAGCNAETCCKRITNCFTALSLNRDFCKGYGSINPAVSYAPACTGDCTPSQCCRESASTCGEAAVRVCGGAVDFFKPCSGTECISPSHCCRRPANCKEAIAYKNVTCPEGSAPTNLELSECPGGQCSEQTCCTQVDSCKLAAAAGLVCKLPAVLSTSSTACDQDTPCDETNCCIAATTCKEATSADVPLCEGDYPIINVQAQATSCSGACDQAKCCRPLANCREAFAFVPTLCKATNQVFNYDALTQSCSGANCATTCCRKERTFQPTSSPSQRPSQPTPRPEEGNKTVAPTGREKCPIAALKALFEVCVDRDFTPYQFPVNCTDDCKKLAASLIRAYASYDVTFAKSCIKEILAAYRPDKYKPETVDFLSKQIEARGGICDFVVNSSPALSYPIFVVGLLALGVIY